MANNRNDLIASFYEVEALDRDQFLKVKETLTRIGISTNSRDENGKPTLWQTCHVLHKRGRYYICHFKQLFLLDGRSRVTDFNDEDWHRTEYILSLLEEWGLVKPVDGSHLDCEPINVTVIPHKRKGEWNLKAKYTMGVFDGNSKT